MNTPHGLATAPDAEFIAFQQAVAGRYSLERELGRGGMGIVYLAREVRLARPVAIKVLPRALAASRPELRERFVNEAQMAARLSHPNIVPIHHVDEVDDFVFFVMTYIEGGTLGEKLRARGALPASEAAGILREIAWALAYAHLRGIVHRDVKPDNILLDAVSHRALVTDFGIAGLTDSPSIADAGYIRGTVHYLSPEQACGEPADARSDIYSLGVVGYYALTGRVPFDGPNATDVMAAHISRVLEPIARVAPAVPRRLAATVEKCLEKLPQNRWQTAEAFAEAVGAAFEQPKEIPAPLRVWIASNERDRRSRVALTIYLSLSIVPAAIAASPFLIVLLPVIPLLALVIPESQRLRRVLRAGYTIGDLRAALGTHWGRRREELDYEAANEWNFQTKTFVISATVGFTVAAVSIQHVVLTNGSMNNPAFAALIVGAMVGLGGTLGALGNLFRRTRRSGATRVEKFWAGKWGERFVRFASIGLKRSAILPPSMPQFTEVALGRATDALFQALAKPLRKQLKDVPDSVRRLETEARVLRETLDKIDETLASVTSNAEVADLRKEREAASGRLGTTVAALESIRLGLLRLQLGAAPVSSVTEALQAAANVGRELEIAADANYEVEQALLPKRT